MPGPAPTQFTTSWRRWPLLFLYVNCVLCLGSTSLCFSPASKVIANAYGTTVVNVNMAFMISSVCWVPMTFVSMYLYRTFPSDWVLRGALINVLAGGWFRLYSKDAN